MRKLNFLKAIIDFTWIMSMITVPVVIFFVGILFYTNESFGMPIHINGNKISVVETKDKIIVVLLLCSYLLLLYGLFLFKKVLFAFQRRIVFHEENCLNFNKIGKTLIIAALISGIPIFINTIYEKEIKLELGLNGFILMIALGLFFMILSELFQIAKKQKEENELTI